MKAWIICAFCASLLPLFAAEPEMSFCIQTHSVFYFGTPRQTSELIKNAGATSVRDDTFWKHWQTLKKPLSASPVVDRHVNTMQQAGLNNVLILGPSNEVIGGRYPKTQPDIDAYLAYVRFVVNHYKGKVRFYQVWNEWEGGSGMAPQFRGKGDVASYVKLLKQAYAVIKETDPDAQVITNSIMRGASWLESACKLGMLDACDIVSFNIYTFLQRGNAEVWRAKVQEHVDVVRRYAKGKKYPVFITEFGWPTHGGITGVTEEAQADNIAQAMLLARTIPEVKLISWYELHDDGYRFSEQEDNFGMVCQDFTPKAAFFAARSVAKTAQYGKFVKTLPCKDGNIRALLFKMPDNTFTLALWSRHLNAKAQLILDRNGSRTDAVDMTIAGRETLRRPWGFQDWAIYGHPGAVRKREPDPELFSVMLTARPVLLNGVPENVKIKSISVQKRISATANSVTTFPPQVTYVPRRNEGTADIVLDRAENWLYLHWGGLYDPKDLSCKMKLSYDDKNLYADFYVTDNRHVQGYPGNEIWQGDSLQIAFAAITADVPAPQNATAYQICRTSDGKDVCLREYSQFGLSAPTKVKVRTSRKGNLTTFHVEFPFSELGVKDPENGFPLAMSLVINENDGPPRNRRGALLWGDGVVSGNVDPGKFCWLFFRRK